jgi:hypothetical protein
MCQDFIPKGKLVKKKFYSVGLLNQCKLRQYFLDQKTFKNWIENNISIDYPAAHSTKLFPP